MGQLIGKPFISDAVFVGRGTVIEQGADVQRPGLDRRGLPVRNGCYVRENVIVGDGVVGELVRIQELHPLR